ncbi:MAG: hypothetical protein K0S68_1090 [Candidatus Saccharibacteria bacterium]|jgi:20S proteasome alpha/beta subunit|nr:hypothetical protein [Candidatus Saccharibacteria bacterium]
MPLVLAIKNRNSIVVATDTDDEVHDQGFGELIALPNHSVILLVGNLKFVRAALEEVITRITPKSTSAAVAQLVQAALIVDIVPKLADMPGRVEIIVAGFDLVRHSQEPDLYYLDSAQEFHLQLVPGDAVAGGATAAVTSLVAGHSYAESNTDYLKVLAKECISATKLRWPTAVRGRIKLGVITPQSTQIQTLA